MRISNFDSFEASKDLILLLKMRTKDNVGNV